VASKPKSKVNGVKPVKATRPFHRPTSYRAEYDDQAYRLALLGCTDVEMAAFFGVSEPTLISWRSKFPKFLKSTSRGKIKADADVSKSLLERALGYSHIATKFFNNNGQIISEDYVEHYPPDTAAASLWLRNRQPEKWRDKPAVEVNVNTDVTVSTGKDPAEMTVPEMQAELAKRRAQPEPWTAERNGLQP
jgi:hypothetical protein